MPSARNFEVVCVILGWFPEAFEQQRNNSEVWEKMASSSLNIDNILIQTRCCLQSEGIKLWLEPYYLEGIGPNDDELEVSTCLPSNFGTNLRVRVILKCSAYLHLEDVGEAAELCVEHPECVRVARYYGITVARS